MTSMRKEEDLKELARRLPRRLGAQFIAAGENSRLALASGKSLWLMDDDARWGDSSRAISEIGEVAAQVFGSKIRGPQERWNHALLRAKRAFNVEFDKRNGTGEQGFLNIYLDVFRGKLWNQYKPE